METFTESRSTKKKKKPYKGGFVDGPENGPAPPPWAIACEPKKLFKDDKFKKEVPHTAKVKVCFAANIISLTYSLLQKTVTFQHKSYTLRSIGLGAAVVLDVIQWP